jgi:hypothetical protein
LARRKLPGNPELSPCFPRAQSHKGEYNQEEEKKLFPSGGKMLYSVASADSACIAFLSVAQRGSVHAELGN